MQHDLFGYDTATQVARLLLQDRILSEAVRTTVFFPSQEKKLSDLQRVLDIGCGPGGWAIDLARQLPQTTVIGIDSSPMMIAYASGLAQLHHLRNCQFHVMDALKPFAFSDRSFDLVHLRTMSTAIPRSRWLHLLKECHRILRTGGNLQLMECGGIMTTSAAIRTYSDFCTRLLFQRYGFEAPDGAISWMRRDIGESLFYQAGYQNITQRSFLLDFSAGTPLHESQCQSLEVFFEALQPMLLQMDIATEREVANTYIALREDFSRPSFQATLSFHLIGGERRE